MSDEKDPNATEPGSSWIVEREHDGKRLDRFLADVLPSIGRKHAARFVEQGRVRHNGRRAAKSLVLRAGDRVELERANDGSARPAPHLPLDVLLERPDLVVANKPAGRPSGALVDREDDTFAGALVARYPEMAHVGFGPREPGLVHRLDTFTSGALLAARTPEAFTLLRAALEDGRLEKSYLAVVESRSIDDRGVVDRALAPDSKNPRRVVLASERGSGRPARSEYTVRARGRRFALVEIRVAAAYRHQIRVHLAARGSPLLGDRLYGGLDVGLGERHLLHASQIACAGTELSPFDVTCPLPDDFGDVLSEDGFSGARPSA